MTLTLESEDPDAPASPSDSPTRAERIAKWTTVIMGAGVFLFAWFFRFNDPSGAFAGLTDDHFFYVVRGWQILFGELPVRDFVDHGAPLHFYVSAAVQMLFGRGTLSELAFTTTMLAFAAALTFWLATRASGSRLVGLGGAAFHVFLMPRFYNYPKFLVYAIAIPLLWQLADGAVRRPVVWLAIVTVIGFLFRHDHGIFVATATALMLLLLSGLPVRQRLRETCVYFALVGALLAPYLVFIQLNGGLLTYAATVLEWTTEERARTPVQFPGLFDNPDGVSEEAATGSLPGRAIGVVRDNGVAWFYYFELALPLLALAVAAISRNAGRRHWSRAGPKIAITAVLALLLDAGFLRSPLAARLADPSIPLAVLVAWLTVAVPRLLSGRRWWTPVLHRRATAAQAVLALASMPFVIVTWAVLSHGLYDRLENANMVDGIRPIIGRAFNIVDALRRDWDLSSWEGRTDGSELISLATYLNRCTPPDARVFVQPYIPQVLPLARRGFAAGYADLRPGFFDTREAEELALRRMGRQNVPVVLLATDESLENFRESFPLITRYFDAEYEEAGTHAFDGRFGITLLVKRGVRQAGTFDPLKWPCLVEAPGADTTRGGV